MSLLAADLNDAEIAVVSGGQFVYREPGFALLDEQELKTGREAYAKFRIRPRFIQHRFWSDLQTQPLPDQRFRHLSTADLVSNQLEKIWRSTAAHGDKLVVAVPPYMSKDNLALLLGIAAEIDVPIIAMVDAAVAATRREYRNAVPVHVDLSLHSTTLTRIAQAGQVQVDRSTSGYG